MRARLPASDIMEASSDAISGEVFLKVVSVHSACANCSDEQDRRWSLITGREDLLPRSLVLGSLPDIKPGDVLSVDTGGVRPGFTPSCPQISPNARWTGLLAEWAHGLLGGDLAELEGALQDLSLHALSGLGPGLTPAGDDFITGSLTAWVCAPSGANNGKIRSFQEQWRPEKTTWFSGCMIKDALGGGIWRRGVLLLEALAGNDAESLLDAARNILAWGHSSGRAWLAGLSGALIGGG